MIDKQVYTCPLVYATRLSGPHTGVTVSPKPHTNKPNFHIPFPQHPTGAIVKPRERCQRPLPSTGSPTQSVSERYIRRQ